MHIPDGYLSLPVAVGSFIISLTFVVAATRRVSLKQGLSVERVSLMTALSASIFVAQMIAWPIPGGTSLHLIGGALAGIILGPWLGMLSMALVLTVQCLVFHDGGITALGANILNMGVVAVITGYSLFRVLGGGKRPLIAGFVAGWLSLLLAGISCGVELSVSWSSILPVYVMGLWHAFLGIMEGVITGSIIAYLSVKASKLGRWS
ncbi:MAG: energy-coupling factor ABC transporter permease [Zestosphaera sp.]